MSNAGKPSWLTGELVDLHETATKFFNTEVAAGYEKWQAQHHVDRSFWRKAGELGFLCASLPTEHGGGGGTFLHEAAIADAYAHTGDRSWNNSVHSGVVAHYLNTFGTEEQKHAWLPKMASGDYVAAVAMTEPSAGSDLKAIRTTAVRDGDEYVINGSKIFISNGTVADLLVVAAKTDPDAGSRGISLIVLEADSVSGLTRGQPLDKIGQLGSDTAELFFDDVRVPVANLLGEEGRGFSMMMSNLIQERLIIGISAVGPTERAVELTVEYVKQRKAFGAPLFDLQNTRFQLAECETLARVARTFIDSCIQRHSVGELDLAGAAMCKWWLTETQCKVIDKCLQLYGGYGYMREYPIARMYEDARAQRIYGGANEIQKELIARSL
jgi:acyl-CoA dehydrogenase